MEPITVHVGRAAPLRRSNVDTDQIVPAVYLKRVSRTGFADGCFAAWRSDPDFVLNRPQHEGASILVAGPDFGTGSSREHAVWALQDYGFAVVLSSRFADIFLGNAGKSGLLAARVDQDVIDSLWEILDEHPDYEVTVDLGERTVSVPAAGLRAAFDIDDYTRWRLMEGLDDIGLTLRHTEAIDRFEAARPAFKPQTQPRPADPVASR
jgi:3-isopropylmalate/(R)-2-methylmalate dehydratase small subunit